MGKKKKGGILGRQTAASQATNIQSIAGKKSHSKRDPGEVSKTAAKQQQRAEAKASALSSPLQHQCGVIVGKLLHGMQQRRSSGSLKTLCLAPNVQVCPHVSFLALLRWQPPVVMELTCQDNCRISERCTLLFARR